MSSQRASRISPLRDRPLSNSPDPVQPSVLRESGAGWKKPSPIAQGSGTTPLRIAKREGKGKPPFPLVARRSSSSYKHLRSNNLVSKSPFRSQIPPSSQSNIAFPAPTPRRVSSEKRPRPESMHEQAENERPLAFKRERRQSKAYQGLLDKEPVTKSPFRRAPQANLTEGHPPAPPPKPASTYVLPPAQPPPAAVQVPSCPVTPSRSSLVSKRLHGPRTADQGSLDGRRRRRKTVTFDERCDVLEFDRDEEEEDPFFSSDEDDYGTPEPDDDDDEEEENELKLQPRDQCPPGDEQNVHQDSFESIELGEADQSLTGIVDALLQSTSSTVPGLGLPSTPSRHSSLPPDLETEDGVPYGRSHHAERARRRASVSSPAMAAPGFPFGNLHAEGSPSTPPRSAESSAVFSESETQKDPPSDVNIPDESCVRGRLDEDVNMMPPSPSPAKNLVRDQRARHESLIPRLDLGLSVDGRQLDGAHIADPFSRPQDESYVAETSFTSFEGGMQSANLSIGQSEVSFSNIDLDAEFKKVIQGNRPTAELEVANLSDIVHNGSFTTTTPPPPTPPLTFAGVSSGSSCVSPLGNSNMSIEPRTPNASNRMSPLPASPIIAPHIPPSRSASPSSAALQRNSGSIVGFDLRRRSGSPLSPPSRLASASPVSRSASPSLRTGSPLRELASGKDLHQVRLPRTRISREDVQARLMRRRSSESPLGSPSIMQHAETSSVVAPSPVPAIVVPREDAKGASPARDSNTGERRRNTSLITDISAEFATIETAERRALTQPDPQNKAATHDDVPSLAPSNTRAMEPRPSPARSEVDFPLLETSHEFGSGLGLGMHDSMGSVQLGVMRSALDRLVDDVKSSSNPASDRLSARPQVGTKLIVHGNKARQIDDAADMDTSEGLIDESMHTETEMSICIDEETRERPGVDRVRRPLPIPMGRAATDSAIYTPPSFRSPPSPAEPATSQTKDAIRKREEIVLEKRRAARRKEEDESMGYYTPPRPATRPPSVGRPSRRRSKSTGDMGALLLDIGISDTEDHLAESISRELRKLEPEAQHGKYRIREHEAIFASADAEQMSYISLAGDVNGGKAWRPVRRPSDMNEYAKQIREYRSQEAPGKAHGKVFVRVVGVKGLDVPIPQQRTVITCTLNNGIHFVTTPQVQLFKDTRIDQEFELIEHNKLEFTLTLKVRRDPHITAQFQALVPPPLPPQPAPAPVPKPKGGMFSFLSSSPKKSSQSTPPPPPVAPHKLPENLARYMKQDGTLARAFVSFKDVAARCDTRLFETSYPLIGQRSEATGAPKTMELGEIVLQIFRLPSLPGVLFNQLPLSLDECLRGLRHVAWHKVTYYEGTLTQNGGDCMTWRRRKLRVVGANLVAFNDVTKKVTATINLKKAIVVEDIQEARSATFGPGGNYRDDYDGLYTVERSFRLIFPGDQEIFFFADTDEEKAKWLEVLRALVGRIPPNPLWAELVWQRQQEMSRHSHPSVLEPGRGS